LTIKQMQHGVKRLQRRIDELEKFDPMTITERYRNAAEPLEKAIDETLTGVFGTDTVDYRRCREGDRVGWT
jgi:hypothetical protein